MLTFVTCSGCSTSGLLRRRLHEALMSLGLKPVFEIVDIESLPRTDPRRAYPAPSVLWGGRDLFGMAEPPAPYPMPT
jgi:hypothetical protein